MLNKIITTIKSLSFFLLMLILSPLMTFSQIKDNPELKKMFEEDQAVRRVSKIDWRVLSKQDSLRQATVYALLSAGQVVTGYDYYYSAMIFQHGKDSTASAMAVKQMRKAIELDTTINKWLLAAAIDRDLMRRGKPQIYGTQFIKMYDETQWKRYNIDTTQITDQERKYYHVETLAQQRIKVRAMNLRLISEFYTESNSLDKTIELIKSERTKGNNALYNISEDGINTFGYDLVGLKKLNEALIIFKLNTELYPTASNAFDSLGECLLMLNRREDGINAYRKSLALNQNNKHAKKIIEESK